MKNINNLESRDGHRIYFTVRNKPDGSKEQFFELNVICALRNNLRAAVEIARQDNSFSNYLR